MNRKEFLQLLGAGSAAVVFIDSLQGCAKNDTAPPEDFTIDLTDPKYSALQPAGGFVYVNSVIIARTTAGSLIAVSKICTHASCTVTYETQPGNFYCACHGSVFNTSGKVLKGPAASPLFQYHADLSGNMLHVYS